MAKTNAQTKDTLITTGAARRLLNNLSYSQIYRYVQSGDLNPVNSLPPKMAATSRKKHTYYFRRSEVQELARVINMPASVREDDEGRSHD